MIKDILHQEIQVGDIVAFNPPVYKGLVYGYVIRLTPKGATMKYFERNIQKECNRSASEIIKITDQMKIAKDVNPELFI